MQCKVGRQEEYRGADQHVRFEKAAYKLAKVNDVRWYDHVLRQPEEDVLMKAMVHELDGKRKKNQSKIKWREHKKGWFKKRSCNRLL